MKSFDEIEKKLRQLKWEHLQKKISDETARMPSNCVHNYEHRDEGGSVRICMLTSEGPDGWGGRICDDEETAADCPFFEPAKSKDRIREEFEKDLMDPEVVNAEYRDISALRWALSSEDYDEDLGWWARMKRKLWG